MRHGHDLGVAPVRFVAAPTRLTADEPRGDLRTRRHVSTGLLVLDRAHRPVRDQLERLRDGRQGRVSQARQHEVVEAGHGDVLGHAPALLAQDVDGAGGHLVVRRHDGVEGRAARDDLLHGQLAGVGAEIAGGDQRRIAGDAVARQHGLIGVEPDLRLRVLGRAREERQLATAVVADEMLDHRLHAGAIVEHQAGHARQLDADAAQRRRPEPLDEPRHAARPAIGRQQGRDDDDAVDRVGAQQLVDGVVGRVQRLRGLHRTAIDQQQVMARLAALGMNRIAELRLIPAAERVQVIEQHRNT